MAFTWNLPSAQSAGISLNYVPQQQTLPTAQWQQALQAASLPASTFAAAQPQAATTPSSVLSNLSRQQRMLLMRGASPERLGLTPEQASAFYQQYGHREPAPGLGSYFTGRSSGGAFRNTGGGSDRGGYGGKF